MLPIACLASQLSLNTSLPTHKYKAMRIKVKNTKVSIINGVLMVNYELKYHSDTN